jgi:hypothetical protein
MCYKNLSLRKKLIFSLDILLFDLFLLSLSPRLTGLPLHEIIGFFLFLPIITHLLIGWNWLANYIGRFFKAGTKRDKFNLLLNVLLFIALLFQLVSGLLTSQVLLPFINVKTINDNHWRIWHAQIATMSMLLVGFHLALNLNRILFYFKGKTKTLTEKKENISINIKLTSYRIFILLLLIAIVAILSLIILGKPSVENQYTGDEIAEFKPAIFYGIIQLLSQVFFVVLTCWIARKWLKVKP